MVGLVIDDRGRPAGYFRAAGIMALLFAPIAVFYASDWLTGLLFVGIFAAIPLLIGVVHLGLNARNGPATRR